MARWMILLISVLLPVWAGAEDARVAGDASIKLAVAGVQKASQPGSSPVEKRIGVRAYKATYEVLYGGFKVGEMTQQFALSGDGNRSLKTVAYTTGLASWLKSDKVVEHSAWRDSSGEVLPQSYTYRYSGQSRSVFEKLGFDWSAGKVSSLRDGKTVELSASPGTLDKHMFQIVLREDLLNGSGQASYFVADRHKIREYRIKVMGEETIEIDGFGSLACLKVKKGNTLFWLAKTFDYLPVRFEKDEDGTIATSYLTGYRPG